MFLNRLYGHLVATYESASTRRFLLVCSQPNRKLLLKLKLYFPDKTKQGRVDCIRSASTEALNWTKAMCQGEGANVSLEENDGDDANRKVKFKIYSVKSQIHFFSIFKS